MGEIAAKQLGKTAVIGYSDFPPGKDMLASFKRAFEANGGKVIDEIPMGGPNAVPGLHAVLHTREGEEARVVLCVRARRRTFGQRRAHLWARSACAPLASS
jgi:hypothetical protein